MPSLHWTGKEAAVVAARAVPYRPLIAEPALSHGDPDSENLLIQGDNLDALKSLLPVHAGRVKCIFIDPPYNLPGLDTSFEFGGLRLAEP